MFYRTNTVMYVWIIDCKLTRWETFNDSGFMFSKEKEKKNITYGQKDELDSPSRNI